MAKITTKKMFAGILALSAGVLLAGCDPISAVPANYNSPIVNTTEGAIVDAEGNVLTENKLGALYDAIATDRNSKIVDDFLEQIAETRFGSYNEFLEAYEPGVAQDAFLEAHKAFFGDNLDEARKRFKSYKSDIDTRISEYFYDEIQSDDFKNDFGQFSEKKFYNAKRYELYDLEKITDDNAFASFFIDKDVTKENAFSLLKQQAQYKNVEGSRGYIKEKVFGNILRDKLVEDYIYQNSYESLGRAYGRKVSYIKVPYEGSSLFARRLAEKFATKYIEKSTESSIPFNELEDAVKGFSSPNAADITAHNFIHWNDPEETTNLLNGMSSYALLNVPDTEDYKYEYGTTTYTLLPAGKYVKETKIGKIIEDYQLAIKGEEHGRFASDEEKTALSSFTEKGKTKQYGLLQELIKLMKEDYTTDGWYVRDGGITDLPSALRDRLFNIRVATSLDDGSLFLETAANVADGLYRYELVDGVPDTTKPLARLPYLRNINGHKVVIPATPTWEVKNQNYVYNDESSNAVYICEVLEAPSTAKLNKTVETVAKYTPAVKEEFSRQIAKILGTKDSYIKTAYTEYLNKYKFTFYDSSLYDYFKSEYPDLEQFED